MYKKEWFREVEDFRYRSKWACFACRKSFVRTKETKAEEVKCPDCGKAATDMGYLFEPPPRRNDRLWKVMEVLGKNGIRYSRAGMVVSINYFITGDNKLTPRMVEANIRRLKGRRQAA